MSSPAKKAESDRGENDDLPIPYDVGYGKPPAEHRFQKGKSGNPTGRPRKSKNKVPKGQGLDFAAQPANQMLLEEAYRTITVPRTLSSERSICNRLQTEVRDMACSSFVARCSGAVTIEEETVSSYRPRSESSRSAIGQSALCELGLGRKWSSSY
jgi:hypothetical protein